MKGKKLNKEIVVVCIVEAILIVLACIIIAPAAFAKTHSEDAEMCACGNASVTVTCDGMYSYACHKVTVDCSTCNVHDTYYESHYGDLLNGSMTYAGKTQCEGCGYMYGDKLSDNIH